MSKLDADSLLNSIDVRLDAYAVCEVEKGHGLRFGPASAPIVSFVLKGEGFIESSGASLALRSGSIVVVPKNNPKVISASGQVGLIIDALDVGAPTSTVPRVSACGANADLVLSCGSVTATLGGIGIFDHLSEPLVETLNHQMAPLLLQALSGELMQPGAGSRAFAESTMKQLLLLLLREQLSEEGLLSPIFSPLMNPQLSRAVAAMMTRPQHPHSLEGLSESAGMSRSRFTHNFAGTYGRSPMEFLHLIRLRAAARMLRTSTLPIKSIAAAVGFASRSHFSRAFRAEFGIDPTAFRDHGERSATSATATHAEQMWVNPQDQPKITL